MKWIFYLTLADGARAVATTTDPEKRAYWKSMLMRPVGGLVFDNETDWLEMNSDAEPERLQYVNTRKVICFYILEKS